MTRGARTRRGQALLALALVLAPLAAVVLAVAGVGRLVADQTRLQTAVDAAAYSAAALQAEALNEVSVANRTHVAHLVTVGQVASLVSHFRVLERAAQAAGALGVALPAVAPAAVIAGRATRLGSSASTALARTTVAAATLQDRRLAARVRLALATADARLARRVGEALDAAAPGARLAPVTRIALRAAPLSRAVTRGVASDVQAVAEGSVDRFTAGRSGMPPLGRTWRLAGVGKSGATQLGGRGGVEAADRLGLDFGPRRRVGVEARARGAEFGYGSAPAGLALRKGPGPAPVRVEASLQSWGGRRLQARAAAAAVYRRPGHPWEAPTLFGPFWRPRLLPWRDGGPGGTARRRP